jgi:hypothetical protein
MELFVLIHFKHLKSKIRNAAIKRYLGSGKLWDAGEYVEYFYSLDKCYLVMAMVYRWNDIPDEYKYEIFYHVYSYIEDGFEEITDEILEDVCRLRPPLPENIVELIKSGKVYRGDVIERNGPTQDTSWTLSMKVAEYFSNRFAGAFKQQPVVWSGKVDPQNIVAYITDRKEEEIVVKRGAVTDISSVNIRVGSADNFV